MATDTKTQSVKKSAANALEAPVYTREGKETGSVTLPAAVFGLSWNADLVHQVVVAMQSNARAGTAHTKFRGEVRGGGKKPWRQKGTGRARHGSRRSPIWTGGGVTHGPRAEKDYARKINRRVRAKALGVVLSKKFVDGEVVFVDSLGLSAPKAKDAKGILSGLAVVVPALARKRTNAALIALPARDEAVELSLRNFGQVEVVQVRDLNPVDLLRYKHVVFVEPAASVEILAGRLARPTAATT
jgi:large subunit ribosomal protein L4